MKCKICGQSAGFLKSLHSACVTKHQKGLEQLEQLFSNCFEQYRDFYLDSSHKDRIVHDSFIKPKELSDVMCRCLDKAVQRYLNNGIISDKEARMVARFVQFSGLSQQTLNVHHSLDKVVQSKVLQDILNGRRPTPNITIRGDFPFMLNKTETLVWLFRNIGLFEQKTRREYQGSSSGMSFRIAKGVYYRTGGFRGTPIEIDYMKFIGLGSVCLTDKNIYFASPEKSLKIPYAKIISVDSYSDGIGLQKEGASSRPIMLQGVDSWFTYNVIANYR